jgi:hypothetical protein
LIAEETQNIENTDEEDDFCSDYFEDNIDPRGYFPSWEEDRR